MNVFADDITIEDDMAVLVKYNTGATMTYHLTAYSVSFIQLPVIALAKTRLQPWEGYRVMFNGDKGRLELEVVESTHRNPQVKGEQACIREQLMLTMTLGGDAAGVVHGEQALPSEGHKKITLQELWKTPVDVPFAEASGGHGGSLRPCPCLELAVLSFSAFALC